MILSVTRLATVILLLLAAPLVAETQEPARKMPRIGVLMFAPMAGTFQEAFRQGLRDHGYVEGQNILVEWRAADGKSDRAKTIAVELAALKVDIIVAVLTPAVQAAKSATSTIPIVMAPAGDPVGTGLVSSLARPGASITGISTNAAELSGKRVELLRELVPGLRRVGLLIHGDDPFAKPFVDETQVAAKRTGLKLHVVEVRRPEDLATAFSTVARERSGAVIIQGALTAPAWRAADLAVRHRLPSLSGLREFAESGGLVSFGGNLTEMHRRCVNYVDKILKGAKPAALPVEQSTLFELVINLRTARVLGLAVPRSLLLRADHVIDG